MQLEMQLATGSEASPALSPRACNPSGALGPRRRHPSGLLGTVTSRV